MEGTTTTTTTTSLQRPSSEKKDLDKQAFPPSRRRDSQTTVAHKMCTRSIERLCPKCNRKSIGKLEQCKAKVKETRRMKEACWLAFWVKEQTVCTTVDYLEGALQKLCKDCHREDVLDTLRRQELRRQKMEREREMDREDDLMIEMERRRMLEAMGFKRGIVMPAEGSTTTRWPSQLGWKEQPIRGGGRRPGPSSPRVNRCPVDRP